MVETPLANFVCKNFLRFLSGQPILVLGFALSAKAQLTVSLLHSFAGGNDGQQPSAGLVQARDGLLYGTTFQGGANHAGTLFKVRPDGSGNGALYSFAATAIDPSGLANPSGLIQGADGALYGTMGFGGSNGYGAVFRINADGTGLVLLHNFDAAGGGPYEPTAPPVQAGDGYLYGTTQAGGAYGGGSLFKVNTNGTGYVTLHDFGNSIDGQSPQSPLIVGLDGALYGTTSLGGAMAKGGASGYGTVFRLVLDGSLELLLHSFGPSDGEYPYTAGLVQGKDGVLYGVTQQGGAPGGGTVFSINPDGSGFQLLHEFGGAPSEGRYPNSSLVLGTDGFLYGATELGGASNLGTLFRVSTDGLSYQVLHTFSGGGGDGANPGAPLIQATDDGLFGTTKFGGAANLGAVFRVAPASPLLSSVVAQGDKTVRLTVTSTSNFIYRIDGSTDHTHWVPLTNLTNTTGSVEFKDTGASNTLQKFYRAVWVP